jgi:hypothetical protein
MGHTAVEQAVLGRFPKKNWPSTGSSRPVRLTRHYPNKFLIFISLLSARQQAKACTQREVIFLRTLSRVFAPGLAREGHRGAFGKVVCLC